MLLEKIKKIITTDKFLIALFLITFLLSMNFIIQKNNEQKIFSTNKDISSWFWKPLEKISNTDIKNYIIDTKKNKIKTIILDISNYIDIIELPDNKFKQEKIKDYKQKIIFLLTFAKKNKIKIEALVASPKWSNNGYRYIPSLLFDFVININSNYPDIAFSGMHFDIEGYKQSNYADNNRIETLQNFLILITEMVDKKIKNNNILTDNFSITFDIPYWFIGKNSHSIIDFNNNKKSIGYHAVDILNKIHNGNIVLMSYKRNINNTNGTLNYINQLITYLNKNSLKTGFYLGIESSNVQDPNLSFYNSSKKLLISEVDNILELMTNNKNFSGVAIHHLETFINLKPK